MQATSVREYIARQRPGWSLEQAFYTSAEIYQFERSNFLANKWYLLGHCSEIPEPGAYMVRMLLGESVIIVRDLEGTVRGFYNVCRHRGSRICEQDGKAKSLVCPYHAWSYRLDGSVRIAPAMPEEVDLGKLGLRSLPVAEIGGLILASMKADPSSLDGIRAEAEPVLSYHGIPHARIAARRNYLTRANWKLVMENFAECYHCFPCHPEYCSVMQHVNVLARQAAPDAMAAWETKVDGWFRDQADEKSPAGQNRWWPGYSGSSTIFRAPIGSNRKTVSADGEPVAPLMGKASRFDGGVTDFGLRPFTFLSMPNDHAVMFQFLPTGPEQTDVTISWLVNSSASDSDVDTERMVWMWDVTTVQDKGIVERNAEGVRSAAYAPGPYSKLEFGTASLISEYLSELEPSTETIGDE